MSDITDARGTFAKALLDELRDNGTLGKLQFLGFRLMYDSSDYFAARERPREEDYAKLPKEGPLDASLWRVGAIDGCACWLHPHVPPVYMTRATPA